MTWLRLDDKFVRHPKVTQLTDREFRVHVRVLCYCAEYATRGEIATATVLTEIPGMTPRMAQRFCDLGLWDVIEGGISVHDFEHYNPKDPTAATRKQRERDLKRDIDRDASVTSTVTEADGERDASVTVTEPRAQAAARGPSRPQENVSAKALTPKQRKTKQPNEREPDLLWDTLEREIGKVATASERGRRNKALKELRDVGATPGELVVRCGRYRLRWPDIDLTATALAANWSTLATSENGFYQESEEERGERVRRHLSESIARADRLHAEKEGKP
jgi:hypothetical protein